MEDNALILEFLKALQHTPNGIILIAFTMFLVKKYVFNGMAGRLARTFDAIADTLHEIKADLRIIRDRDQLP